MDLGILEETPEFFFEPEVHCTDFYELIIFSKGNGHILLDAEKIELQKNTFLFISPYQKRRWYVDKSKISGYFLIFEKDFLSAFFSDKLFVYRLQYFYNHRVPTYYIPNKRLFSYQHDIMEEISYELRNFQKDSPHLLRSILYYMLIKMNRVYCEFHNLEADTHLNNYAYQFKELLEKHIRDERQVNDYAKRLGISRISLNAAIKKQFGITATDMIKERLLFEIKTELLYTTKNISEIAFDLHFSEPNNLIRLFKSKTGLSPNAFRKTYQIDSSI
jgi:AraC-like DNA-binding protein